MPDTERSTPPATTTRTNRWRHGWDEFAKAADRARHHVHRAYRWARAQPRDRWLEIAGGTAMFALALLLAWWAILSVIGWFTPAPPPPPRPAPVPHQPPPHWLTDVNHVSLWQGIGHTMQTYAAQNAPAAGTQPWLLLATWIVLGAVLLLGSWFANKRFGIATLAWCAWVAATAWVLWTHTPGGSPVPAVLFTALSVTAAAVPISTPFIAAFVVLGIVPTIT